MSQLKKTQEQIDDAKKLYGESKVKLAQIPMDENGTEYMEVLMKEPKREAVGQYSQWMDKNSNKANEILIKSIIIDKEDINKIMDDTGLFLGAVDACASMIPVRKSIVKNC